MAPKKGTAKPKKASAAKSPKAAKAAKSPKPSPKVRSPKAVAEEVVVAAAPAKTGRTRKAAVAAKSPAKTPKSPVAEAAPEVPKAGRKRAAKKDEPAEGEPPQKSPKVAPAAKGRGKKAAAPKDNTNGDTAEAKAAPAKKSARGKKAAAETTDGASKSKKKADKRKVASNEVEKEEAPKPKKAAGKRKAEANGVEEEPKKAAGKRKAEPKEKAPKLNKMSTNYDQLSFDLPEGKEANYKVSSWNVAGLRAWVGKQGLEFLSAEAPDILCLQETKCTEDQLPEAVKVKGYHTYWHCLPGGRDGVALYSKTMPYEVKYGIADDEQDAEARVITAEYSRFYLVNVYVPNSGRGLVNLEKRQRWDSLFRDYVKGLDAKKPVIVCGDMNVAHSEIDLANPKTNQKNAGFTPEEREGMTQLLSSGFVDTFRLLYPEREKAYTFWTYMGGARAKNVGWRLDYFLASERLQQKVVENVMRSEVMGSDHCPITLFLNL